MGVKPAARSRIDDRKHDQTGDIPATLKRNWLFSFRFLHFRIGFQSWRRLEENNISCSEYRLENWILLEHSRQHIEIKQDSKGQGSGHIWHLLTLMPSYFYVTAKLFKLQTNTVKVMEWSYYVSLNIDNHTTFLVKAVIFIRPQFYVTAHLSCDEGAKEKGFKIWFGLG
jgi:hypothetical protein